MAAGVAGDYGGWGAGVKGGQARLRAAKDGALASVVRRGVRRTPFVRLQF